MESAIGPCTRGGYPQRRPVPLVVLPRLGWRPRSRTPRRWLLLLPGYSRLAHPRAASTARLSWRLSLRRVSAAGVRQGLTCASSSAQGRISFRLVSTPFTMRARRRHASARAGMHERGSVRFNARAKVTAKRGMQGCLPRTRGGGKPCEQTHSTCRVQGLIRQAGHEKRLGLHTTMRGTNMRARQNARAQGPEGDTARRHARTGSCR